MLEPIVGRRLLLAAACLVLLLATIGQAADRKDRLTDKEKRVIDYLVHDWDEDYSATSVDLAMDAVGVKQSDETRFHIGSYIKQHPELHEVIRRWSWVTFVLTPDEKLIARALIDAQRDGKPAPSIADIAKAVSVNDDRVKRGLSMLAHYEIIKADPSVGGAGFRVESRYLKWEPRLDFLFHTVTLAGGRKFNTN
jgi:hypothetical protein